MAVSSVTERIADRTASADIRGQRRYTRTYWVHVDDREDTARTVLQANDLPVLGDPFPGDAGAVVVDLQAEVEDGADVLWRVTVEYDTETGNDQDGQQEEDPLDRPAEIEWGMAQYQKPVSRDLNDNLIMSSGDEIFDPAPEIDDSRPVLRITRNEATFDPAVAVNFQDAVNEDNFAGFAAEKAKVALIAAQRQFENGVEFWRVVYEFHFRREGWNLSVQDRGYYFKVAGTRVKNAISLIDENGNVTGEEASITYLNGAGSRLDISSNPVHYLQFEVYKKKDFNELGLTYADGSLI